MIPASHTIQTDENDNFIQRRTLTWKGPLDCQTNRQYRHQRLVGHRIDDRSDDGLKVPPSRYVTIDQICDSGVGKKPNSPGMVIMENKIADDRRCNEPRESEDVWNGVYIFVRGELRQDFENWLLRHGESLLGTSEGTSACDPGRGGWSRG